MSQTARLLHEWGRAGDTVVRRIPGNSPEIIRKHYGRWSMRDSQGLDDLMGRVYVPDQTVRDAAA